jgi:hypothetical protein
MEFQKLLLLFSYFALSTVLSAQQAEVLLVHGKIEHIVPGQQQWTAVQLPFTASKGQFRLASGSIMVYKISGTEKTVQLKKPGTYSIPALITHASEDGGSLTRAIGSQLVKSTTKPIGSKGSVSRGSNSDRAPLDSTFAAVGALITFRNNLPMSQTYRFRVENEEGDELIDTVGTQSEFSYVFTTAGTYNWRIDVKGNESRQNITSLVVEKVENFDARRSEYESFLRELSDTPDQWKQQLIELYFEEHPTLVWD